MAYAEVSDIEARWRTLTETEQTRASVLIDDASAMLSALVDVDESDAQQEELLKVVTCNMVIRSMSTSEASFGLSQTSITAGPYTQSYSNRGTSGDMYLTKRERQLLGISSSYIGSIRPKIGGCDD